MKNKGIKTGFILLLSTLLFSRCSPEQMFASTAKDIVIQGTWSVGYYFNGQDQTAQFHNYVFDFSGDNTVTVTFDTATYQGSWSQTKDNSRNDVMTFSFGELDSHLSQLNGPWNLGSVSLSSVGMKNAANTQLVMKKL